MLIVLPSSMLDAPLILLCIVLVIVSVGSVTCIQQSYCFRGSPVKSIILR